MATSVKTYPDDSVNGAADQSITDLVGLPSIPAGATLDSVVLSFTCDRKGGRDDNEIRVRLGSTIHYYIQDLGRNDPRTCDITGIVRNNNGKLTYIDGSTSLNLYAYHAFKLFDNANWKLTNIKITATYTLKHTVTFNPNGGSVSPTSVVFDDGATYGTLPIPTKDGHTFSYWAKEDGTRIYSSTKITSSHTLVANWTVNSYNITVKANNDSYGRVGGGGTFDYGGYTTMFAEPYAGYKFVGWDDGVAASDPTWGQRSVWVYGDATYIAIFEPITYTVTFKDENGATLKTETVNYGSTVTAPSDPVKADTAQHKYTFDGWYDANGNKWYPNTAITGDTVYTARFNSTVQMYAVRWYNEDGSALLVPEELVPYGIIPKYNGATPTKAETAAATYEHIGWSVDVNSSGTTELTEVIEAVDYYARFRAINKTYTVVWKNDDGTVLETDKAVPYGDIPDYNGSTPTKDDEQFNYTFLGWSANVEDPPLDDTELPTVTGNITYTAVYEKTPKIFYVTVAMLTDKGDILGEYLIRVTEYGRKLVIEAEENAGYRFVKWTDGNTDSSRTITVTASVDYEAIYERVPVPIFVNEEQRVTGAYIVPATQTIVYVISGEVPAVVANGVTVDDLSFRVSNSVPDNSYPTEKLYINETRVY